MGRSPFYAEHVKPVDQRPVLHDLDSVFSYFFQQGTIVSYQDGTRVATLSDDLYIKILQSQHSKLPVLERSCSIYRKLEDNFPDRDNIYRVQSAIHYVFCNKHSDDQPFVFQVLELTNLDHDYYTTFCVKTDGAILNIESLSLRGYASKVDVSLTIDRLCAV